MIDLSDGTALVEGIVLYREAVPNAGALFDALRHELELRQEYLQLFGRDVAMPRLTAWYGDPGATYTYSRLRNEPAPWTPALGRLRDGLRSALYIDLNSCPANWYRDGNDSMGWHADREPELRDAIVSVTLGAERTFQLREGRKGTPLSVVLPHGSVLVMTVASQHRYAHRIPKERDAGERLNLTFRQVTFGDQTFSYQKP
ncbi:MAG: alpha-ketoglutarate-dependent dioxygenase AlkB [Candidatus Tumulicola sp.]